jgi:hypothetical protein
MPTILLKSLIRRNDTLCKIASGKYYEILKRDGLVSKRKKGWTGYRLTPEGVKVFLSELIKLGLEYCVRTNTKGERTELAAKEAGLSTSIEVKRIEILLNKLSELKDRIVSRTVKRPVKVRQIKTTARLSKNFGVIIHDSKDFQTKLQGIKSVADLTKLGLYTIGLLKNTTERNEIAFLTLIRLGFQCIQEFLISNNLSVVITNNNSRKSIQNFLNTLSSEPIKNSSLSTYIPHNPIIVKFRHNKSKDCRTECKY